MKYQDLSTKLQIWQCHEVGYRVIKQMPLDNGPVIMDLFGIWIRLSSSRSYFVTVTATVT